MNSQTKQILRLNKKFYQSVSKNFSNSRQFPWKGWDRAVKLALINQPNSTKVVKILDLGCGNGRFAGYIAGKLKQFTYTGYDTNNDLLSEAKTKYESTGDRKIKFVKRDIISGLSKIRSTYNLIVCFGVTHHIPDKHSRIRWVFSLSRKLKKGGVLILTFWDFEKRPGDYLIGWDKNNTARYCHQYSSKEITDIKKVFAENKLKLLDQFNSDNENLYLIFGNI